MLKNRFSIQESFAISAGAGSGKTYTLSRRYINAYLGFDFFIEEENQPQFFEFNRKNAAELNQIVTITYTEAAALEMKERIFTLFDKILNYSNLPETDKDYSSIELAFRNLNSFQRDYVTQRISSAFKNINNTIITTIHGFCLQILKRYADFVQFDTKINVISEDEKTAKFEKAIFEVLNSKEYEKDILFIGKYISLFKSKSIIKKYVFDHRFREIFDNLYFDKEKIKVLLVNFYISPIKKLEFYIEAVKELPEIKEWIKYFENYQAIKFNEFLNKIGKSINFKTKENKEKFKNVKKVRDTLEKQLKIFSKIKEDKEDLFYEILGRLKKILIGIRENYKQKLEEDNQVDFDEIIEKAYEIIKNLYEDFDYKYIMLDEFQDTNEIQWDIAKRISKGKNLFIVGDEQQSIYSFQGGDIEVFKNALEEEFKNKVFPMNVNYRSNKIIISFINYIFQKIFKEDENIPIKIDFCSNFQELKSFNEFEGEVTFLITKKPEKNSDINPLEKEAKNIAKLIKAIKEGEMYPHISKLIKENKKAIGVLYDSRAKMIYLKKELNKIGIECKINATENFWNKEEIVDIFFILKSLIILSSKNEFSDFDKFFFTGALKSNIIHYTDKEIYHAIKNENFDELKKFFDLRNVPIHILIRKLFIESGAYLAYAYKENIIFEQVLANIEELLYETIIFESQHGYNLEKFVEILEKNILFSDTEKEEAFYEAENLNSIELSTIHSTKGLEYPMIILADSSKNLTLQSDTEGIKFNKFKSDNGEHLLIGFKIEDYRPLTYRLLTKINRLKHIAEKKRLLYVALTRAKNNIIISMYDKNEETSYANFILEALNVQDINNVAEIELEEFKINIIKENDINEPIEIVWDKNFEIVEKLAPIRFSPKVISSPTESDEITFSKEMLIGTVVHKIIELYHDRLEKKFIEKVLELYSITENEDKIIIYELLENFKNSKLYKKLINAEYKFFEFPYETEESKGVIDLLYFDKDEKGWVIIDFKTGEKHDYSHQLNEYKKAMENMGLSIKKAEIFYLKNLETQ